MSGLHILGKLEPQHIKANPKVKEEYERLRNDNISLRPSSEIERPDNTVLTLSLLNVRSLRKHCKDVKVHPVLFNSDVLALTETQLFAGESCDEISENLRPFKIYRQDHATDKFSSMAVCIKSTLTMVNQEYIPSLNALKFVLLQIGHNYLVVFFYCIERTILMSHNTSKQWPIPFTVSKLTRCWVTSI